MAATKLVKPKAEVAEVPNNDPELAELLEMVPKQAGYVPRVLDRIQRTSGSTEDFKDLHLFEMAWDNNRAVPASLAARERALYTNILLKGPTGAGKTMAVSEWCARTGRPM